MVAVDWSGDARAPERRSAVAEVADGELRDVRPAARAPEMAARLIALAAEGPLLVGLDFVFGFPEWFARERLGARSIDEVWAAAERDGERWLAACEPPFWGRGGRPRPPADRRRPEFRRTDLESPFRPKSVFQIGGGGAPGTGSIRGMPLLRRLRAAGFAIWPFDDAGPATAVEIYPRVLTGPVVKSRAAARRARLEADGRIPAHLLDHVAGSEDRLDAALSALEMWRNAPAVRELRALPRSSLEGAIWRP